MCEKKRNILQKIFVSRKKNVILHRFLQLCLREQPESPSWDTLGFEAKKQI